MKVSRKLWLGLAAGIAAVAVTSIPASAQQPQKPNILFIMGDDIGWMQPSIYHRGLMVGETPNIDRIGNEGAIFMDYVAMQSCTSGRNAFFTGMYPLRTGMIPPQLPGSPSYLRPGTPAVAKFLIDLGYTTGEFGKNHLGDHTAALPTALDMLFFSITTLTSTGYGDITPVAPFARSMSQLEQLVGVFYIAVLISRLIGLYPSNNSV